MVNKVVEIIKTTCPTCKGKGNVKREVNALGKTVKNLRSKGFNYQQIMEKTGIKSLSHVHYYLNTKKQAP